MTVKKKVILYTDGACLGNPGPGGYAGVLIADDVKKTYSGGEAETTNNRMELRAVIEGLILLKKKVEIHVYTDSKYVKDGMSLWVKKWQKAGWVKSDKKPVKNKDLWQDLVEHAKSHDVHWHWVKAHAGDHYNEMVDDIARGEATKQQDRQ